MLSPFLFVMAMLSCPADARPKIAVTPIDALEGEPLQIIVSGLKPGQPITVRATRKWLSYPTGHETYESTASFAADRGGVVDFKSSQPKAGSSYERPDEAGLFWSMTAKRREIAVNPVRPDDELNAGIVVIEAKSSGEVIARTVARVRLSNDDVAAREIRDAGVTGVFARDRSKHRQPAIIVLGGSEGGLFTARWAAPILASRGYSVLGLGYFQGEETALSDLPQNLEQVPLERLARARDWLARQPGVDAGRIAVVGVSKGAEFALVGATVFPWVTAVAAFAPTHVVWEGIPLPDHLDRGAGSSWTFENKPLPYVRWSRSAERRGDVILEATGSSRLTDVHLESLVEFAADVDTARISLDRGQAAVFVAAGLDDGMWPAAYSAEQLRRNLERRNPTLPSVFEIHPTGHQVMGNGWNPTAQFQRSTGRLHGGNARLDAQAQKVIWPSFLHFLDRHLRPEKR